MSCLQFGLEYLLNETLFASFGLPPAAIMIKLFDHEKRRKLLSAFLLSCDSYI
jgi:hypothetical protein